MWQTRYLSYVQTVLTYEKPSYQAKARACMPLDIFEQSISLALEDEEEEKRKTRRKELLLGELTHWFKVGTFFFGKVFFGNFV